MVTTTSRVCAVYMCKCVCAYLVAELLFGARGPAPPPQFDGRGPQQVLDAAADGSASVRGHRAVSCPASCASQQLQWLSCVALSAANAAAAVMLSAGRPEPGRRVRRVVLLLWFWTDAGRGLRFHCCSASYSSAAAKTRSGLPMPRTGLTHRQRQAARGWTRGFRSFSK